jgi:chemotaxis protein CheD
MGQMAVTCDRDDDLFAVGLGSCIGLAVVDRAAGVAGLAHIVLPESPDGEREIGKFADLAVPELISRMRLAGAVPRRMEAVLVGGARMFAAGELDIGARNAAAVREALAELDVAVRATAIGGARGRTVRISLTAGTVTSKEAGGELVTLLGPADARDSRPAGATEEPEATGGRR